MLELEPDITSILTQAQIDALNTMLSDQTTICEGSVYSVIANKPSHPSHNWRRILGF